MYEYEFVKIELSVWTGPKEDYQQIVRDYAEKGWRLVQIFAPGNKGNGGASFYDLIFEREKR